MASKYWLKLFHETIYDPKIMMRSPGTRTGEGCGDETQGAPDLPGL